MKILAFVSVCIVFVLCVPDSQSQQKESTCLIIHAKVSKIPAINSKDDAHLFTFIDYEVLKVLHGAYAGSRIRVAHTTITTKDLEVGGIVCLKLRKTDEFRRMAKDLLETGKTLPEEFIADYVYAGYKQSCSCSPTKSN